MKTSTQGVRITPKGAADTEEGFILSIRTANGDLKSGYLLKKLREKDRNNFPLNEVLVPQNLIAEILAAYRAASRHLKARNRENAALKAKIAKLEEDNKLWAIKYSEISEENVALRAGNADLKAKLESTTKQDWAPDPDAAEPFG